MEWAEQNKWKLNIKKWGRELGFAAVGFTSAQPVAGLDGLLQDRFKQGVATPFEGAPTSVEQRVNPQNVWQQCQTVAALAYPLPLTLPPQKGEGVIARSAVGEDYHKFMHNKINILVDNMLSNGWIGQIKMQVDTGLLVERALALRAGIGWIGRNQQLIIPGQGSFTALGLLLLDQEIPEDQLLPNQCGDCQKCIQACPAQIIGRYPFAAKHCVSYLTQSKDILTPEECQSLGLRIFGCDTCQEVCPHNRQRLQEEQKLSSGSLCCGVDLLATLDLSKREFQAVFKNTAAGWRGKSILQRNAFLALRSLQDDRLQKWLAVRARDNNFPPVLVPYLPKQEAGA